MANWIYTNVKLTATTQAGKDYIKQVSDAWSSLSDKYEGEASPEWSDEFTRELIKITVGEERDIDCFGPKWTQAIVEGFTEDTIDFETTSAWAEPVGLFHYWEELNLKFDGHFFDEMDAFKLYVFDESENGCSEMHRGAFVVKDIADKEAAEAWIANILTEVPLYEALEDVKEDGYGYDQEITVEAIRALQTRFNFTSTAIDIDKAEKVISDNYKREQKKWEEENANNPSTSDDDIPF